MREICCVGAGMEWRVSIVTCKVCLVESYYCSVVWGRGMEWIVSVVTCMVCLLRATNAVVVLGCQVWGFWHGVSVVWWSV